VNTVVIRQAQFLYVRACARVCDLGFFFFVSFGTLVVTSGSGSGSRAPRTESCAQAAAPRHAQVAARIPRSQHQERKESLQKWRER